MTVRMVLASKNAHKLIELRRILEQVGLDIDLVGTQEFPDLPDVDETGTSFAANGLPAIADDSGICVDALNGMPGIYSARWAGNHGDDAANLALLIAQLDHVPARRRGAAFHCAAAIVTPEGDERVVEGTLDGVLITEPRGSNGFGYDPIFMPLGYQVTTAEMSDDEKDAISHRGRALAALAPVIEQLIPEAKKH